MRVYIPVSTDISVTPEAVPGRCNRCGFHTPTQGHRDGCPQTPNNHSTTPTGTRSELVKSDVAEGAINTPRPLTHPSDMSRKGAS